MWLTILLRRKTMPKPIFLLLREFEVWFENREIIGLCSADKFLELHTHLFSSPANHTTVINTQGSIWDDELFVDADYASVTLAGRTGTQRRIEGKHIV